MPPHSKTRRREKPQWSPNVGQRADAESCRWLVVLLYFISLTGLGTLGLFAFNGAPRFDLPRSSMLVVSDDAPELPAARPSFGPIGSIVGFNGAGTPDSAGFTAARAAAPSAPAARAGSKTPAAPAPAKAGPLAHAVRDLAPRFGALYRGYRARYPIVAEYEREWMSTPELRKLRDEFMHEGRDPVRFIHGLARSKAFVGLFSKYAGHEPFRDFAKEAVKLVPANVLIEASTQMAEDRVAVDFAKNLASAAGYPLAARVHVDPALAARLIRESRKAR